MSLLRPAPDQLRTLTNDLRQRTSPSCKTACAAGQWLWRGRSLVREASWCFSARIP